MTIAVVAAAIVVGLLVVLVVSALKVIPEYERAVFFRLGHLKGTRGPGLIIVLPLFDRIVRVGLRTTSERADSHSGSRSRRGEFRCNRDRRPGNPQRLI